MKNPHLFGEISSRLNLERLKPILETFPVLFLVNIEEDKFLEYSDNKIGWLSWLPTINCEDQIYDLGRPSYNETKKILEANVDKLDFKKIAQIVEITTDPALAVMLYMVDLKEDEIYELIDNMKSSRYTAYELLEKIDDPNERKELLGYNIVRSYRISALLYDKLRRKNFAFASLIAQPYGLTQEHLRQFCKDTRDYRKQKGLISCYSDFTGGDIGIASLTTIANPNDSQQTRKFYELKDLWLHLVEKIEFLSTHGFIFKNKEYEFLPNEILLIRKALIRVLDNDAHASTILKR